MRIKHEGDGKRRFLPRPVGGDAADATTLSQDAATASEEPMFDSKEVFEKPRGRRAFLGELATSVATGAGALALSGVAAAVPDALSAAPVHSASDAEHWLDGLKGKHKQVVDAINVNDGWPLGFAYTFLATLGNDTGGAVIVLRHFAMPMALQDSLWAKYKIGESLKVIDPADQAARRQEPVLQAQGWRASSQTRRRCDQSADGSRRDLRRMQRGARGAEQCLCTQRWCVAR